MKPKEMILDFTQWVFSLTLVSFFIVYFIVGDRFTIFTDFFLKLAIPLGVAGLFFLTMLKRRVKKMRKLQRDDVLSEILSYITKKDKIKDIIVIGLLPLLIMGIAIYDADFEASDVIQAVGVAFIMLVWHRMLFREREVASKIIYLTNFDKYKDELVIFFIPVLVMIIGAKGGTLDVVDWLQAGFSFTVLYVWHHFIFKHRET